MKLQTSYDTMTDKELFIEMKHRLETFGDTLGGYQTGGIKIARNNKELWLNDLNENECRIELNIADPNSEDPEKEPDEIVTQEDEHFRELLLTLLQAKYQLYNLFKFSEERDQQQQLANRQCETCRCSILEEPMHEPIAGHMETFDAE